MSSRELWVVGYDKNPFVVSEWDYPFIKKEIIEVGWKVFDVKDDYDSEIARRKSIREGKAE